MHMAVATRTSVSQLVQVAIPKLDHDTNIAPLDGVALAYSSRGNESEEEPLQV